MIESVPVAEHFVHKKFCIPQSQYNNQQFEIEWSQNNTILFQNPIETSSQSVPYIAENMNGMDYDPSKIGSEIDLSGGVAGMFSVMSKGCFVKR